MTPAQAFVIEIQRRYKLARELADEIEAARSDLQIPLYCNSQTCNREVGRIYSYEGKTLFASVFKQRPGDGEAPWARVVKARGIDLATLESDGLEDYLNRSVELVGAPPEWLVVRHNEPHTTQILDIVNEPGQALPGLWARCSREHCSAFQLDRFQLIQRPPKLKIQDTWRHPTA